MKESEQSGFIKYERVIFQRIFRKAGLESLDRQVDFVVRNGERVRDYSKAKYNKKYGK